MNFAHFIFIVNYNSYKYNVFKPLKVKVHIASDKVE